MNQLNRIWIVGCQADAEQIYTIQVPDLEIKIVSSVLELKKSIQKSERLILLAKFSDIIELEKTFTDKILSIQPLADNLSKQQIESVIYCLLQDAKLQHDLEVADQNIWNAAIVSSNEGEQIYELLSLSILEISKCRSSKDVQITLIDLLNQIASVSDVQIAINPPYLSSKLLGNYQLATPILFHDQLIAHVYVQFSGDVDLDRQEQVADFLLGLQDVIALVVERNRMIEETEFNRAIWEVSFNAVGDPVVITDYKNCIIEANLAYQKLVNTSLKKLKGNICQLPDQKIIEELTDKQPVELEEQSRTFRVTLTNALSEDPSNPQKILFMRDISNEKKLTENLVRQAKGNDLGILIGSVAHELNNPLGGISALSQLLLMEVDNKHLAYEVISGVLKAADRCKMIIQTMLSLVRNRSEQVSSLNITQVFQEAVKVLNAELNRVDIDLHIKDNKEIPLVNAKNASLLQIFFHLLQHAISAIEARKRIDQNFSAKISFFCQIDNNKLKIFLTDNGQSYEKDVEVDSLVSYTVVRLLLDEIRGSLQVTSVKSQNLQIIDIPLPEVIL